MRNLSGTTLKDRLTEDDWVPDPAYTVAHSFRQKHGNELSFELVNSLLSDLNKIWRERERKQIMRVKAQAREELNQMKRQLSHRTPYDQLVGKKTVAHLKTQVDKAKR